jgi:hypothetical protein
VAKNGATSFLEKNHDNFFMASPTETETEQKASRGRPLHIGIVSFSGCPKMENFKKKRKLKNRHLMKFAFIISKSLKFIKLHPGSKVSFFES